MSEAPTRFRFFGGSIARMSQKISHPLTTGFLPSRVSKDPFFNRSISERTITAFVILND